MSTAVRLRALARRPPPAAPPQRCDLCAGLLPAGHRHLLDAADGTALVCACGACALLFGHQAAGRYRLVPRRRIRLAGHRIDDLLWAALGVPVHLAFFVPEEGDGAATASYPGPLGAPCAAVDAELWRELAAGLPEQARPAAGVEALLVDRQAGEHWIVPVDDCRRLVAVLRAHWKGLSGGPAARARITDFFRELATDAPAPGEL
ncbi:MULTISPECIES: DUF5947 family protein [Streptomyces]|uniref:Uncharacterized protein n=1 Tax=Streptomyces luteosporeus TaxID=173856 RepID=A0ABN3U0Z7_9ACTN